MNRVRQVATLFNKDLKEQFMVRDTFSKEEHVAYFNEYGFCLVSMDESLEDIWFRKLINGMVEIVEEKEEAEKNEPSTS